MRSTGNHWLGPRSVQGRVEAHRPRSQGDLPALWEQLRDGTEVAASRACSSVDWQKIMGAKEHILFEVKSSGPNVVFVRFRSADTARKHRFGKELL